jgi:sulfate permease, SulP family
MNPQIVQGIVPVKRSQILPDIIAGITLATLSIPEVMGYTKIAGTPVITGLYTLLIPMTLFALFGSSRHLVVGADSATAAILAGTLTGMTAPGSAEWLAMASVLALLSAGFLIIAVILRLGFLADFLSRTVLTGFLTGVGVQVAAGELPGMLGIPGGGQGTIRKLMEGLQHIDQTNLYALAIAGAALVVVVGFRKLSKKIPGALIAVIGAVVVSSVGHLADRGVQVLGAVPSGLPQIGLPDLRLDKSLILNLLPAGFAMFVVIAAQSAATARACAVRYHERLNENVDLLGLGVANIGAAFSATFVVNGSPTKTQMVDSAGGRSQLAQITTSFIVLMVLLFLTGPLAYLPGAVLSTVVFLIGMELIDVKGLRTIWVQSPSEFWVALITAIVVVAVGVEQGILLAMALSLADHVRRSYRPKNVVVATYQPGGWRVAPLTAPEQIRPGLMVYRFTHSMYYANADQLLREVEDLASGTQPTLSWFCIEASAVADVDFTAAAALRSIHGMLKEKGVRLVFADVLDDTVRAEMDRFELTDLIGKDAFYPTLREVVDAYDRQVTRSGPKGTQG